MAFPKVRKPKQSPRKRNKVQALFWLDPAMAKLLKRTAARLKVSQSELVRKAFEHAEKHQIWESLAAPEVNTPRAATSERA